MNRIIETRKTDDSLESLGSNDSTSQAEEPETEHHQPLGGYTPAESLFLAGLTANPVNPHLVAQQLRGRKSRSNSSVRSGASTATDDFNSCVQSLEDLEDASFVTTKEGNTHRNVIIETDAEDEYFDNMASKSKITPTPLPKKEVEPAKKPVLTTAPASTTTSEEKHMDPASHVYEGAKGVWAWGKGVPLVKFGLGLTEAVASKVVSTVGADLEGIDGAIKPKLSNLDSGVLNPAIEKLVEVFLGAAGKTEDILKPIITLLLSPFKMIKSVNQEETPEVTAK